MTSGRAIRPPGVRAILLVAALCALVIVAATLVIDSVPDPSQADPGRLTEPTFALPPDTPDAVVSDATEEWGLAARVTTESVDPMAGGLAVADLDRDGDLDLVVAHGSVDILRWENGSYEPLAKTGVDRAMSVTIDDIDRDGWPDLLIARDSDRDLILWGGSWLTDGGTPVDVTELDGAAPSSGLLAGELSGDRQTDILRLGRGRDRGEADILWVARPDEPRGFDPIELPDSRRLSLAAELVDVDGDDLTDIWITRDLGWNSGGDSILSRQGDPTGPWTDVYALALVAIELLRDLPTIEGEHLGEFHARAIDRTNRPTPRRAVHRPDSINRLTTLEMVLGLAEKRLARVRTEGRRLEAG